MELVGFLFKENGWAFDYSAFQSVNLLVGKNASGKSRVVTALNRVIGIMLDRGHIPPYQSFETNLDFSNEGHTLHYAFTIVNGSIVSEEMVKDGNVELIARSEKSAIVYGEQINPPVDKLVVHIRRDTVLYPEIEWMIQWGSHMVMVSFTQFEQIVPYSRPGVEINQFELFDLVKKLSRDSLEDFYALSSKVGFGISQVKIIPAARIVFFKEIGVKPMLSVHSMSTGMVRTINLLLYMVYFKQTGFPALILADDLCEGLDYDHSVKLGKEIFEYCNQNHIQLIATSNDAFLMDIVDVNYWCILRRNGDIIQVFNKKDNSQLFDDFQMTGLSNFDFFSSDFIDRHLAKITAKV